MKLLKVKTQPAPERSRFDVFISYSRDDDAFVRRLYHALSEKERRAWIDWKGIPPTADWMAELYAAIQSVKAWDLNGEVEALMENSLGTPSRGT